MTSHVSTQTLSIEDVSTRTTEAAARPCLVLAMNCTRPSGPSLLVGLRDVDEVVIGRHERLGSEREIVDGRRQLRLQVDDPWMSTQHFRLVAAGDGSWMMEDLGSKNGTRVNGARHARAVLADGMVIDAGRSFLVFRAEGIDAPELRGEPDLRADQAHMVTLCRPLRADLERLAKVATARVPVLVYGESGTGKELVARAVHEQSGRSGPFMAVNCGALPETLVESELFGVVRGAFSGATESRDGLVRAADKGTLFLDEIGELPPSAQAALLRVLQEGEVMALGSTRPVKVDVRVVAATHRHLDQLVQEDLFRNDLYARLRGFEMALPPVRERREDLGLLIGALLARLTGGADRVPELRLRAARALMLHDWQHNVRGLRQALDQAVAIADGEPIELEHLPVDLRQPPAERVPVAPAPAAATVDPRERLVGLLHQHGGNLSAVARAMNTSRSQVRRLVQRYQLDLESFRP